MPSLLLVMGIISNVQTGEGSSKDLPSKVFSETQVDGQTWHVLPHSSECDGGSKMILIKGGWVGPERKTV